LPRRTSFKLLLLVLATSACPLAFAGRAAAQVTDEPNPVIFPDPTKFARGLYTEGELGGVAFFGKAGARIAPGFAVGARLGYDLTGWLAVQVHALGSTHETTVAGFPQDGQLLQLYQGTVEAKATLRFGQTSIFADGGLGAARLSSNILSTIPVAPAAVCPDATAGQCLTHFRTGFTAGGGAGFDYHSLSRHFSVGLHAGFYWLRDISESEDLIVTSYLRYTF
jgi:opacity protein-like surface antigen